MSFDRLPDGVGPDDCEPEPYPDPDDPDRRVEWECENMAEIEEERKRAAERRDQLPWEVSR